MEVIKEACSSVNGYASSCEKNNKKRPLPHTSAQVKTRRRTVLRMYDEYIEKFMPSKEMREYLKKVKLVPWQLSEMIYFSPNPINDKLNAMKKLLEQARIERNTELIEETKICVRNMEDALNLLVVDGIFTIDQGYFSDRSLDTESGGLETLCEQYADVVDFIKKDMEYCEVKADDLIWYDVTKWTKDENGKYKEQCDYVFINGELVYIDLDSGFYSDYMKHISFYMSSNLNLPVPFKPGDIVEVDEYPYGPQYRMLIIMVGDNWDCCCVQGIARNKDGLWDLGAVKHGMVGLQNYPQLSPLYTIKTYHGEYTEDEKILLEAQAYLNGDERKGEKLQEVMSLMDAVTNEEFEELLALDCDYDKVKKAWYRK
jgi:hypothetical protein